MHLKIQSERNSAGQPVRFEPGISLPVEQGDELQSIRASLGDYFAEMSALFLEDSPKRIAAMRRASAQSDLVALAFVAHALNGSAASFGALGLAALCRDLSRNLHAGMHEGSQTVVQSIEVEYAKLETRLRAFETARRTQSPH